MVGLIWTDTDDALGEVTHLLAPVSLPLFAPSANFYTLTRLDWVLTLRCQVAGSGTVVPYWWVSAEVQVDVLFATDGVDPGSGIPGDDKRVINRYQMYPEITYAPTAGSYSIVWRSDPAERQTKGQRKATVLGSLAPAVFFDVSAADQHGGFSTGSNVATRAFAVNLSARALWKADF